MVQVMNGIDNRCMQAHMVIHVCCLRYVGLKMCNDTSTIYNLYTWQRNACKLHALINTALLIGHVCTLM